MADLLFEVEDRLMAKLEAIARGRGQTLEDYVRELIHEEARRGAMDEASEASK